MIVLDTTVLVYAVGTEHPLRAPCRGLIELARDGVVRLTTTVEVIQEFAHVRSRRRPRQDVADIARVYAIGLAPLVSPAAEELLDGLWLFARSPGLGPFDAVLAATAQRRGWTLASADRTFAGVEGLSLLDPASASFLSEARETG